MFENKQFFEQVDLVRKKFGIPSRGMRELPSQEWQNNKYGQNDMALQFDGPALKSFGIQTRSHKREFEEAVTKLRVEWELPARFQQALEYYVRVYAPSGAWPRYGLHATKTPIRYWKERGEMRLVVEVYGDTKEADWREAWRSVKRLQKDLELPGSQLFRHKNYYLEKRVATNQKRVHRVTGEELEEDDNALDYDRRGLLAWRGRKQRQ